jgi:predicted nucleotidyltransferase
MNIQSLLSTPQRARILEYVLEDPERASRVARAAHELKITKGLVSAFFHLLEKNNIVEKKAKGVKPNMLSPITRMLKILINLEKIDSKPLLRLKPRGIGLYGSWARGTNSARSDVDIWVTLRQKAQEKDIALAQSAMSKSLGADVQLLVLDPQHFESVKQDPTFYPALVYSSILLYGENIESED